MRVTGRLTGSINFLQAVLTLYGPDFFLKYKKIYATCKAYFDISD